MLSVGQWKAEGAKRQLRKVLSVSNRKAGSAKRQNPNPQGNQVSVSPGFTWNAIQAFPTEGLADGQSKVTGSASTAIWMPAAILVFR